jgi:hypothetical protein
MAPLLPSTSKPPLATGAALSFLCCIRQHNELPQHSKPTLLPAPQKKSARRHDAHSFAARSDRRAIHTLSPVRVARAPLSSAPAQHAPAPRDAEQVARSPFRVIHTSSALKQQGIPFTGKIALAPPGKGRLPSPAHTHAEALVAPPPHSWIRHRQKCIA